MKINSAIIISILVTAVGFLFGKTHLWIPLSIFFAGIIDLFFRQWIASNILGRAKLLSAILKVSFSLIGFYAIIGQIACIGLIFYWFF